STRSPGMWRRKRSTTSRSGCRRIELGTFQIKEKNHVGQNVLESGVRRGGAAVDAVPRSRSRTDAARARPGSRGAAGGRKLSEPLRNVHPGNAEGPERRGL